MTCLPRVSVLIIPLAVKDKGDINPDSYEVSRDGVAQDEVVDNERVDKKTIKATSCYVAHTLHTKRQK